MLDRVSQVRSEGFVVFLDLLDRAVDCISESIANVLSFVACLSLASAKSLPALDGLDDEGYFLFDFLDPGVIASLSGFFRFPKYPPLGYDVKDRQLVINEHEAATVRRIFERFSELRSATELCRELALDGITTKAWKTADGNVRNGTPMDKKYLAKALRNPVYVGELRHKGMVHVGQHTPIITRQLWDRVQAILNEDAAALGRRGHRLEGIGME